MSRSVAQSLREIVPNDPVLRSGLHLGLLNLTQVSRFLQPAVAARMGKPVQVSAISMGLSRLQRDFRAAEDVHERPFVIDRVSIHRNLAAVTVVKSDETRGAINRLVNRIHRDGGYITLTEGIAEITAILEDSYVARMERYLIAAPRRAHRRLAGLGIHINPRFVDDTGILYRILQQIALQGIGVVEVASTRTEFNLYLPEAEIKLAFDAVLAAFSADRLSAWQAAK